ncbi:MAG: FAD-dependent oxidoreductase, partial [Bdellovibrionaceae bacterium]|nr:FAD-dependent oxidoreductase [Pseudobdellovibrionaceae bacterium]
MKMLFAEAPTLRGPTFSAGRRRFVASAVASSALVGCSSFDRWVMGDNNRLNEEVMVLGGGIAGLAAAYHLKKNKIHYRLYEASSRLGGRVQSIQFFNADQQVAETGAEFFEGSHKELLRLCKDFNLTAQEVTYEANADRAVYWIKGKVMTEREFRRQLKPIAMKLAQTRQEAFAALPTDITPKGLSGFARASAVDEKSLADLLAALKTQDNKEIVEAFEGLCTSEWGVEANEINLLQFLTRLDFDERSLAGSGNRIYRVKGGASQIVDILGERVQGIVASASLKMEHQLVAIRGRTNGFECTFKTPGGSDVIWARQVICALPWSVLKDVDGIQSLNIHPIVKTLIAQTKYASHSKVIASFKEPVWKKRNPGERKFQGQFRGELAGQNYWDSSRGQTGGRGLMTSQRGGTRGASTGAASASETLKDLRKFYRDQTAEESSHVANWSTKPFSKGSRYNVGPGSYLKYLEFLGDDNSSSTFYFAGEHTSFKDFGTMNGALQTAIEAADKA